MKNVIVTTLLLLSLFVGQAYSCDLVNSDLPEEVKKSLEAECLQKEAEALAAEKAGILIAENSPQRISEYANIAGQVSQALVIAAKELGVAANDFMQTPAGLLVVFIILFKVLGDTIMALAVAVVVHLVVFRMLRHLWFAEGELVETARSFLWWSRTTKVREKTRISYRDQEDTAVAWSFFMMIACFLSLLAVVLVS